ncbi:MAG: 50S ribosomal protein L24 [Rhodospirillaceae bacterium]|mgnify:FL=1|jgi:large subunit ribosomal protein L24|nr:50S ribosomal protein L24 [Rhodospirillaceae bacterium]MBT3926650.1 50S ribosomal protein L24 [Rhodospirillaceae bacterium]MBT4426060.1 50S ribosomal protein L24 [Rhodospirillaceae bacterium]MBT5040075.1 50S ribosomal protein L24 [Rhodospirillaceae bacterium]MBT5676544.1 50S ribosomal protein L24 [Rhodospirillaceae bacterium]
MAKRKIKKDDEVIVLSGRDKGRRGSVKSINTKDNRVVVDGVNMMKRHVRPSQTEPQGGIQEREASIHISNVALIDPSENVATRVGYKVLEDGRKVRYAKRSGEVIDV